jgi:hypothetical protein
MARLDDLQAELLLKLALAGLVAVRELARPPQESETVATLSLGESLRALIMASSVASSRWRKHASAPVRGQSWPMQENQRRTV